MFKRSKTKIGRAGVSRDAVASMWLCGALLALTAVPACNIIGPMGYLVAGPEKVPREFSLDPEKPTVVFIDDRGSRLPSRSLRSVIGESAQAALLEQHALKDVIASRGAIDAISKETYERPMSIVELGEKIGAKTVVYVTVDEFTLSVDGQTYSPRCALRVKVVDVDTQQRVWPGAGAPQAWHRMVVEPQADAGFPPTGTAERTEANRKLAERAGREVARLFYDAERETSRIKGSEP